MPSDVLGTSVFHPSKTQFEFRKGPIFSNIVLIDEINRAPAKTQAALFEVMEERQVTNDGTTYLMDVPFLVMATRSEEHTSELQSLMRISYAVFCLKKQNTHNTHKH